MKFFINPVEQTTSDSKETEFLENATDIVDFNTVCYDWKENGFEKPTETEIEVDSVDDSTCHPTQGDVSMNRLLNIKGWEWIGNFKITASRVKESQSMKKCVKGTLILVLVSVCLSLLVSVGMMKTALNSIPTPGYFRDLERNVTKLESKLADLHGSGCCHRLIITSTGPTLTYQSEVPGTYIKDGISREMISYKNDKDNDLHLHSNAKNEWMVSPDEFKGTDRGWIYSKEKCGSGCPESCTSWRVYTGFRWVDDTTLSLECED